MPRCHVSRTVGRIIRTLVTSRRATTVVCIGILTIVVVMTTTAQRMPSLRCHDCDRQHRLDYIGRFLRVKFDVLSHSVPGFSSLSRITLTNAGPCNITAANWTIYFSTQYDIEKLTSRNPLGNILRSKQRSAKTAVRRPTQRVRLKIIQSNMYALVPLPKKFDRIRPGDDLTIMVVGSQSNLARCLNMPNWYVAAPGLEPRVLESTRDQRLLFVGKYTEVNTRSSSEDPSPVWTPERRYEATSDIYKKESYIRYGVLPSPRVMQLNYERLVTVDRWTWTIVVSQQAPELFSAAQFLQEKTNIYGIQRDEKSISSHYIIFVRATPSLHDAQPAIVRDSYDILIDDIIPYIRVTAADASGAFYAVQTLLSLMADDFIVPSGVILDAPRFSYRGIHLDVARNFRTVPEVIKLLEVMSMYKLNRLHLHLSDDQGWRLEIPALPELTLLGSKRCHDPTETKCLLPLLGSGPFPNTSGSGFYTTEDYKQILRYSRDRHIEIVPEIDLPGHSRAAIKSMLLRYHLRMRNGDVKGASEYLLTEIGDESQFLTVQGFNDSIINPCLRSTYKFIDTIMRTLRDLHTDISPLKVFHFGGDEVPASAWEMSEMCLKIKNTKSNYNINVLKKHFIKGMARTTQKYSGLSLAAWEDGMSREGPGGFMLPFPREVVSNHQDVYVYHWKSDKQTAYDFANAGYKVILSDATDLYLDHPQEPDPEETGLFWATRYTDMWKVFSFEPLRLYSASGYSLLEQPKNVIGMEASLWGELIRSAESMHSQLFPRSLALAERAWHEAQWEKQEKYISGNSESKTEHWQRFSNLVGHKELSRLDKLGVTYWIPPPGARLSHNILKTSTNPAGLIVEYSLDGGCTWDHQKDPVLPTNVPIQLRTRSADRRRTSRVVSLNGLENVSQCLNPPSPRHYRLVFIILLCSVAVISLNCILHTRKLGTTRRPLL